MSTIYVTDQCHIWADSIQLTSCQPWGCHRRLLLCPPKDIDGDNAFELCEYFSQFPILARKVNVREQCSDTDTSLWALCGLSSSAKPKYPSPLGTEHGERYSGHRPLFRKTEHRCSPLSFVEDTSVISVTNRGVIKAPQAMGFPVISIEKWWTTGHGLSRYTEPHRNQYICPIIPHQKSKIF